MSPRSVFITGCNRGIGLELVKQYLSLSSPPTHLFATYRTLSDELKGLADGNTSVKLIKMDLTDFNSYPDIVNQVDAVVGDSGLNLLINNAGVLPQNRDLKSVTPDDMMTAFKTNCVAPLFFARAMLPLLERASKHGGAGLSVKKAAIIQMSTAVASIAENSGGSTYAYRCSKSALNMSMKSMSVDLKDTGILVMAMHPGWVLTDMGGPNAQITTETCCKTMIETLDGLTDKDHGTFLRYNNTPIQW
eukprot:TRINITY_DN18984_c0_g1_i1.p1 TRINITY_DN18984_c0_g1~~TRINITY_DN18984_c0_g1_i1.p1  ORF type:complete len:265 (-),score=41.32 TRINITY_DN18984_c0_g1_i1:313-1053(-)